MAVRTALLPLLVVGLLPSGVVAEVSGTSPGPIAPDLVVGEPVAATAFEASFDDIKVSREVGSTTVDTGSDAARDADLGTRGQRTGELHSLALGESLVVDAGAIRRAIRAYRRSLGDVDALLAQSMDGEFWHLADVHLADPSLMDGTQSLPPLSAVRLPELEFERRTHLSEATSMLYVDFRLRHVLPEDLLEPVPSDVEMLAALDEMERLSSLTIGAGGVTIAATE